MKQDRVTIVFLTSTSHSVTTVPLKSKLPPSRETRSALRTTRFPFHAMNAILYDIAQHPKSVSIVAKITEQFQGSIVKLYQFPGSSLSLFQYFRRKFSNGHSCLYTLVPEDFLKIFLQERGSEPRSGDNELLSLDPQVKIEAGSHQSQPGSQVGMAGSHLSWWDPAFPTQTPPGISGGISPNMRD